jgi:hypothetical protein
MKTKISILVSAAALAISAGVSPALAGPTVEVISTFDYPGTGNLTRPQKINDKGEIIGIYLDPSLVSRGFVRFRNGRFSPPIVAPDDTGNDTEGRGINNSRLACGDYLDSATGTFHGFFLTGRDFMNYDVPGSTTTIVLGVNNANDFCGSATINSVQQGFVSIGGTVTAFAVPRAVSSLVYQINDSKESCGYFIDAIGDTHGFYRDSDGTIHSPVDPPGGSQTILFGNNNSNIIVGRYFENATGITHGIVFFPPGKLLVYDYPGSTYTSLNGINNSNVMVGRYLDASGIEHGIIARLVPGGTAANEIELQPGNVKPLPAGAAGAIGQQPAS